MNDICNFIPAEESRHNIEFFHFVYETDFEKICKPTRRSNYYAYLIFKGTPTLQIEGIQHELSPGSLFFTRPFQPFKVTTAAPFSILYISFNGQGAEELLTHVGVVNDNCVFHYSKELTSFWMNAVRRVNEKNATLLTECVLLYTLSFINCDNRTTTATSDRFNEALDYINTNYADVGMSVVRVADMFFYNEKYFSALFIKRTAMKFTEYVNRLRVQHAIKLIKSNRTAISNIALESGFNDPAYFSKVFKRIITLTPQEYIKQNSTRIS